MRIFISAAETELPLVRFLLNALQNEGHRVFSSLLEPPSGEVSVSEVQHALAAADLYLFLVSPTSVAPGSQSLSELRLARDKWAHPRGRVIPILAAATDIRSIPAYLRAISMHEPEGDIGWEIVNLVIGFSKSDTYMLSIWQRTVSSVKAWCTGSFRRNGKVKLTKKTDPLIFVSYRREDSEDFTYRLCERLRVIFGQEAVFVDIDHIPYGIDFRSHIRRSLEKSNVLLPIIGQAWLSDRIFDPDDLVATEIEIALATRLPIIPILTARARMPTAEDLPKTMRALANRNYIRFEAGRNFDNSVAQLIAGIKPLLLP